MWLLLVEAGVALFLLVFIVWWTMYQGPQPGHDAVHDKVEAPDVSAASATLDTPDAAAKTDKPDRPPR